MKKLIAVFIALQALAWPALAQTTLRPTQIRGITSDTVYGTGGIVTNGSPTITTPTLSGTTTAGAINASGDLAISKGSGNPAITLTGTGAYSSVVTLNGGSGGSGYITSAGGTLRLNAPTGQNITLENNNSAIITINASGGNGVWGATTRANGAFSAIGINQAVGSGLLEMTGSGGTTIGFDPVYPNVIVGEPTSTSDDAQLAINYTGYNYGTTKFRDFRVYDGKNTALLFIDGSAQTSAFTGTLSATGDIGGTAGSALKVGTNSTAAAGTIFNNATWGMGFVAASASTYAAGWFDSSVNPLMALSSTGLAVTGALSATGTLTVDTAGGNITWGTYSPIMTAVANASTAAASGAWQYMRVGNTVTVSGQLVITGGGAGAQVRATLPVASALTNDYQLAGSGAVYETSSAVSIIADTTNDAAYLFQQNASGGETWTVTFTYRVL